MHARLEANVLKPAKVERQPVRLTPIDWGKRDKPLATGVLHSIARMTPRASIPFNTVLTRKLREFLEQNGVPN